jgi:hypothetical protein
MSPEEHTTEELRAVFAEREDDEAARAETAEEEAERRTHARRSDKAAYLKDKLAEQAEADERG